MVAFTKRALQRARSGLSGALLEVLLIFIGITLAIAFENWNTERATRAQERAVLEELRSDLLDNLAELERNIASHAASIEDFDTILARLARRAPYSDDMSAGFGSLENFASPYLASSAYETLRNDGLSLVSDAALRREIVRLFEGTYATLTSDYDRMEWINYEVSMLPLVLAHVEDLPEGGGRPVAYESLFGNRSFRLAVVRTKELRRLGVALHHQAFDATNGVIEMIETAGRIEAVP